MWVDAECAAKQKGWEPLLYLLSPSLPSDLGSELSQEMLTHAYQ